MLINFPGTHLKLLSAQTYILVKTELLADHHKFVVGHHENVVAHFLFIAAQPYILLNTEFGSPPPPSSPPPYILAMHL